MSKRNRLKNTESEASKTEVDAPRNKSVGEETSGNKSYIQWSVGDSGVFIPCFNTVNKVPAGIYEMHISDRLGFYIQKQAHFSDDLLDLPIKATHEILRDIGNFWGREDMFKKYGYTHKRGVLLYGPPGNGKSYLIQSLCRRLIKEQNGVVFNLKDANAIEIYLEYAGSIFRMIEPNRPIIVIMEDIDSIMNYSNSIITKILNILDGLKQISKVVYIATTNYPEQLQERISSRPSRFDRRYKIKPPGARVREYYIKAKLKEEDLKGIDLDLWVKETQGLSLSHIKELIVSVIILGLPFEEALARMREMKEKIPSSHKSKSVGFNSSVDVTSDEEELYDEEVPPPLDEKMSSN